MKIARILKHVSLFSMTIVSVPSPLKIFHHLAVGHSDSQLIKNPDPETSKWPL